MRFADLIETAAVWNRPAMYCFVESETIGTMEHRELMLEEIQDELFGNMSYGGTLVPNFDTVPVEERTALLALGQFVKSAPIGVQLSECMLEESGMFAGWDTL